MLRSAASAAQLPYGCLSKSCTRLVCTRAHTRRSHDPLCTPAPCRFVSCANVFKFVIQPLNIIDLVSIVPWYVELALDSGSASGTAVFRVLRLLRVFRVLKLGSR